MKQELLKIIWIVASVIFFPDYSFSQSDSYEKTVSFSIPPIALLDVEPEINNSVIFSVSPSTESGSSPQIQQIAGEALWINYSSALEGQQISRSVVAQISSGMISGGFVLKVEASEYQGSGSGQLGNSTGEISLTDQPQAVITDVGNCFTGNGQNNGHLLNYSIEVSDFSEFSADEFYFTILYTISDN